MGLFSFIKDAGANVFGIGKTTADENTEKARSLQDAVNKLGFGISDMSIIVEGENAKIWGEAASQATKEKTVLVLGNTNGIASVEDNMTVALKEEEVIVEAKFHAVVSGDNLGKIAKEYYGNAMKYTEIFEANKPMLSHPDKIYVGQTLRIPALEA